ncbi:MAG: acyl-CoA carboxylase epsilon subunit [Thermomicrobiales bacterium]
MSDRQVDITVRQRASDEELAAIVAVVEFLRSHEQTVEDDRPGRSRWAEAARRESLRDGARSFEARRT